MSLFDELTDIKEDNAKLVDENVHLKRVIANIGEKAIRIENLVLQLPTSLHIKCDEDITRLGKENEALQARHPALERGRKLAQIRGEVVTLLRVEILSQTSLEKLADYQENHVVELNVSAETVRDLFALLEKLDQLAT